MSILAGLAAGAGLGVVQGSLGSVIQYHNQKALNEQAQRNYERNLRLQQKLNLQSSFQQVANSTAALRAAGISPVVATGANFNAPAVSAPMQSSSAAMPNFDVVGGVGAAKELSLVDSQKANVDSATELNKANAYKAYSEAGKTPDEIRLLKAQAAEKELYNRILVDKNAMAADLLVNHFKNAAEHSSSYAERDFNELMAEKSSKMSVGALIALTDFYAAINSVKEYERNDIYTQLYKAIKKLQLGSDSVLYSMAHMDEAEFKRTLAQIDDLLESRKLKQVEREILIPAQVELLGEQSATETSKRSLMGAQEDLTNIQKEAIPQTLRMEHNKNFIDMVDEGEYGKAALSQLPLLINGLENFLLFRFLGRGSVSPSKPILGKHITVDNKFPANTPKDIQKTLDDYYKGEYGD